MRRNRLVGPAPPRLANLLVKWHFRFTCRGNFTSTNDNATEPVVGSQARYLDVTAASVPTTATTPAPFTVPVTNAAAQLQIRRVDAAEDDYTLAFDDFRLVVNA